MDEIATYRTRRSILEPNAAYGKTVPMQSIIINYSQFSLSFMPKTLANAPNPSRELASLLRNSIRWVAAGLAIGALIGLAVSQVMHPRWTAKMTVQLGQISSWDTRGTTSRAIENQLTATDRCNLPSFRLDVLTALGLPGPDNGDRDAKLVFDSLHANPAKSPDLINLQVSAYSRQAADAALTTALRLLSAEHQKQYEAAINDMKRELRQAEADLAVADRHYEFAERSLRREVTATGGNGQSHNVLVTNMATLINSQALELRQRIGGYRDALEPARTYPTRIVGTVYTPASPSTPSMVVLVAIGAVLGVLGALAFALLRNLGSNTTSQLPE